MKATQLDTRSIAKHLREQGQRFFDAADVVEALPTVFSLVPGNGHPSAPVMSFETDGFVSATAIRDYVTNHGARVYDLARHFKVTDDVILKAIESSNGEVAVAQRGWVKTRDQIVKDGDARKSNLNAL